MNSTIILASSILAVYYGYVALRIFNNPKHHKLCKSAGYDPKKIAFFWFPYFLYVLVLILFYRSKK